MPPSGSSAFYKRGKVLPSPHVSSPSPEKQRTVGNSNFEQKLPRNSMFCEGKTAPVHSDVWGAARTLNPLLSSFSSKKPLTLQGGAGTAAALERAANSRNAHGDRG